MELLGSSHCFVVTFLSDRVEDRAILQECQGKAASYSLFSLVAARINRTPSEVNGKIGHFLQLGTRTICLFIV